jgi:hypothetical protein
MSEASLIKIFTDNIGVLSVLVGWVGSTIALILFLGRWFGRFETSLNQLVNASEESKEEMKELRHELGEVARQVSHIDGRVSALEKRP